MSFWPNIYKKIFDQVKIIEYRRRFPKDCSFAYMYVSKPVKAICGIVYFGKIHKISDWETQYKEIPDVQSRILKYKKNYLYGAEISAVQYIEPITLEELRKEIPNFHAPQSYILLENNELLAHYLENKIVKIGNKITNNLENIFPEHVCKEY